MIVFHEGSSGFMRVVNFNKNINFHSNNNLSQMIESSLSIVLVGNILTGKSQFFSKIKPKIAKTESKEIYEIYQINRTQNKRNITIKIIDASGSHHHDQLRKSVLMGAHSVLIFFDVTKPETFDDITIRWLPYLEKNDLLQKVSLIGNKIDKKIEVSLYAVEKLKNLYNFDIFFTNSFDSEMCIAILNKIINKTIIRCTMQNSDMSQELLSIYDELQAQSKNKAKEILHKITAEMIDLSEDEELKKSQQKNEEKLLLCLKLIKKKSYLNQSRKKQNWEQKKIQMEQAIELLESKLFSMEKNMVQAEELLKKTTHQKKILEGVEKEAERMKEQIEKLKRENEYQEQILQKIQVKFKEKVKQYQLLDLFKESRSLRSLGTVELAQIQQKLEEFTHATLKNIKFYFNYDKENGNRLPSDRKKINNSLVILKVQKTLIMFYSRQKLQKNAENAIVMVYQQNHGLKCAELQEGKRFCSPGVYDLTYGEGQIKILLMKGELIINKKNDPFIKIEENVFEFFHLQEQESRKFEDCEILRVQLEQ